jgi:putative membrane protein
VTNERLRPRAFKLESGRSPGEDDSRQAAPIIEEQPDHYEREALARAQGEPSAEEAVQIAQRRGVAARALLSWGGLFWSALSSLLLLAFCVWVVSFLEGLYARAPALGYVGLALAGLAALALIALFVREARGVLRQRGSAALHMELAEARARDDRDAARLLTARLIDLYAGRADTARARAHLDDLTREIVDGRDLIDIAERELMNPLDARVAKEIADAAKRVSVVTAISPRAIVDLLFVAGQAIRLVRTISEVYGGRPGLLGFFRLLKSVGAHLAITGGMAAGDSLVQQVLGHGVASRISARLGEGVLNGLLTARVGLSAMAVCRPLPFAVRKAPGVSDVAPFLFSKTEP